MLYPSESVKNKIGCNSLSYTLLFYCQLSLFTDAYFTSSNTRHYLCQRLACTCCKYPANPKRSIHKQPQLYAAKVRFFGENNERKTRKISMLNDNLKQHREGFPSLYSTYVPSSFTFNDKGKECALLRNFFQIRFYPFRPYIK